MLKVARPLGLIDFFCENNANYIFQIRRNIEVATYCLVNPQQTIVTCLVKITLPNKRGQSIKKNTVQQIPLKKHTLQNAIKIRGCEQLAQAWVPIF